MLTLVDFCLLAFSCSTEGQNLVIVRSKTYHNVMDFYYERLPHFRAGLARALARHMLAPARCRFSGFCDSQVTCDR